MGTDRIARLAAHEHSALRRECQEARLQRAIHFARENPDQPLKAISKRFQVPARKLAEVRT